MEKQPHTKSTQKDVYRAVYILLYWLPDKTLISFHSEIISLTTVVLIAAIRAVLWVVTPPGLTDALPISTPKLRWWTCGRSLCMWLRHTTKLLRFIPPISAVSFPITQLVSGQADVRCPARKDGAVLAWSLVTPVATVIHAITKEM